MSVRSKSGGRGGRTRRAVAAQGAAGAVVLAACGGPESGVGAQSAAPYTLVWGLRTTATPENTQAAIRDFRATRPHVTVDTFDASGGIDQIMQKLTTGLAGGVPLDVVMGPVTAHMFVESINILQPLEDLARKDRFDFGKYSKEVLDSVGRYNGKVYALPYGYGANLMGVIYNRSLFASAGVPAPSHDWAKPWTWDQFRDSMRKLTRSEDGKQVQVGSANFGNWVTTPPVLWDTHWVSPDFKTVTSDTAAMIDAYTKYSDLLFRDRVLGQSPGADLGSGDPFLNGKAAVTTLGAAPLGYVKRIQGIDWSFTTMPKGKSASADLTAVVLGLAKTSKNPPEAWAFLKFLDDKSRMATLDDRVPTILADAANWTKENFAAWPNSNPNTLIDGIRVSRPQEPAIRHPQWAKMSQEVLTPGWQEIIAQRKSIVEFLREAKPRLQQIVDEHLRRVGETKPG